MNPTQKLFLGFLAIFFTSTTVFASSNEWGNGGHGVRCAEENGKTTIGILDLYEELERGSVLQESNASTLEELIDEKIEQLKILAPKRFYSIWPLMKNATQPLSVPVNLSSFGFLTILIFPLKNLKNFAIRSFLKKEISEIKNSMGNAIYRTGSFYGNKSIQIASLRTVDLNIVGSDGVRTVNLEVNVERTKKMVRCQKGATVLSNTACS